MKIICTQENLKGGLATVGRVISSSNSLPILNNILAKTENGLLKISATNLEIGITTRIRCKIEKDGEVTVLCKTLTELVNNLPNQNITLFSESGQLSLETERYHTAIKTMPAEDFPIIPAVEEGKTLSLDAQELKHSLDQVVFAVSTNQTQPEISGILFLLEEKILRIVATDRYRLAEKQLKLSKSWEGEFHAILPQKTILEISRIIGQQKGNIDLVFGETQMAAKFNETEIVSRLIDGQYPPYQQIIPDNFKTELVTKKQPLLSALRTSGIFSQSSNSVKFEYNLAKQALFLNTESAELGKSEIELPAKITGGSGSLMLNYHYVLDCLDSIEGEDVVMKITDDNSPTLFTPKENSDYLYLVMPIKG